MPIQPRTEDSIYNSIRSTISDRIDKVSNFLDGSFNDIFLRAHSQQMREAELKALAAELAGYVDYAGKELNETDMTALGIDNVEPSEINPYMDDEQLDNLAANLSVSRDPGQRATGTVTFETSDDTIEIPEGFTVSTPPDLSGETINFYVDADGDGKIKDDSTATVSPSSGSTTVQADIIAADVGDKYNVGANAITHLPNPLPGVLSVPQSAQPSGGEAEQSNESLRDDLRNAIFAQAEGGTIPGVESAVSDVENVRTAEVNEFAQRSPPFVDVVVAGGDPAAIRDEIASAKPVGIEHNLVRPEEIDVGVLTDIIGAGSESENAELRAQTFLDNLGVGDTLYQSQLRQTIQESDTNIVSVPTLSTYFTNVQNETHTYTSGTNRYAFDFGPFNRVSGEEHYTSPSNTTFTTRFDGIDAASVAVEVRIDDTRQTVSSSNITVTDASGNGRNDTIQLDTSVEPDENSIALIDYEHDTASFSDLVPLDSTKTYTVGTDFSLVDDDSDGLVDSIDFSVGGNTPNDQDRFQLNYAPNRSFSGDEPSQDRRLFVSDPSLIDATQNPE